ncbi:VPLPA-CTERM sorting domain-containing protein [Roseovarius sp.]|jgi:hypothetical protein
MTFSNSIKSMVVAAALVAGASTGASALTLGTITDEAIGGDNDGVFDIYGTNTRDGYFGATLFLNGTADILIEYLGSEAGFDNTFTFGGTTSLNTGGGTHPDGTWDNTGALGSATVSGVGPGILDFAFITNGASVANGSNPDGSVPLSSPDFFVSFDANPVATFGQSITLWFDDGGIDDNHDDMAIRLSVKNGSISTIPLPAAGWLLLGAFGGLGALRRFRKS